LLMRDLFLVCPPHFLCPTSPLSFFLAPFPLIVPGTLKVKKFLCPFYVVSPLCSPPFLCPTPSQHLFLQPPRKPVPPQLLRLAGLIFVPSFSFSPVGFVLHLFYDFFSHRLGPFLTSDQIASLPISPYPRFLSLAGGGFSGRSLFTSYHNLFLPLLNFSFCPCGKPRRWPFFCPFLMRFLSWVGTFGTFLR